MAESMLSWAQGSCRDNAVNYELKQHDEAGEEGGLWEHAECVHNSHGNLCPRGEMGGILSREEEGTTNTKAQRLERCEK